jgi:site-specific recombinase XerD
VKAVQQLDAFLRSRGIDLAAAGRDDIEAYLTGLLARWKPATAANRYRALRVFYAWLEDDGEIPSDPMAKMKPPRVLDQPPPCSPRSCCGGCRPPAPAGTSRLAATAP